MAKSGNNVFTFTTDASVKRFFEQRGYKYDLLVDQNRNYNEIIPLIENMIGSSGTVSEGLTVSRIDMFGNEDGKMTGPGVIIMSAYQSQFEEALSNIEEAIRLSDPRKFITACTCGVASVESYLNMKAEEWNKRNLGAQLIDSKNNPVSLADKIGSWIPIMTNGKKLDKGIQYWHHFKRLQSIRDNIGTHPKQSTYSFSLNDLVDLINYFRTGIAGLLLQLHLLFNDRVPSNIIRAKFAPDVEVRIKEHGKNGSSQSF